MSTTEVKAYSLEQILALGVRRESFENRTPGRQKVVASVVRDEGGGWYTSYQGQREK